MSNPFLSYLAQNIKWNFELDNRLQR